MALIRYRDVNLSAKRMERVMQINAILSQYKGRVSVRQAYYRLVAADIIANKQNEYDKIQALITDARYGGLIDWDAIEDRNREPLKTRDWENGRAALDEVEGQFRLDRWATQPFYVEVWCEKAALAGVLGPIADDYHVTLMINRGYSSASAMKESADRIRFRSRPTDRAPHGHRPVILSITDHDPSGRDMIRDTRERLKEFGCPSWLDVRPVALTWEQIEEYKPPPNLLKRKDDGTKYKDADGTLSDSRAREYAQKYGDQSWEVDALPPNVLDLILRSTINAYVDKAAMEKEITRENIIKNQIRKFSATFKEP